MKYFEELKNAIESEDFCDTEDVLEKIKEEDDSIEYVQNLLQFMGEHPDIDYGMPGPVVRYIERYFQKGYEALLYESLSVAPTQHTLWMLNRILNSPKLAEKDKYLALLERIAENADIDETVREDAQNFLDYQNRNK